MRDKLPAEPEPELEALVAACIEAEARGDVTGVESLLARRPDLRAAACAQLDDLRRTGLLDEQPAQIGNYRVIARLGSGGMGSVYLAEQLEPVQRHVALKLVRQGLQTRDVIGRFALERQSLAMMQHANIAGVYDAGITADGRPYFVMEYVDGLSITDYADLHRLTTDARLRLFLQACEGVQHAHLRGVMHRDLKPSNILVAEVDGKPVPKIIDFGIAKVIDQRLSSMAQRTEHGMLLGTPEYMSPEQADGDAQGVDLRTDVYSLGVVLYELLTGTLPFASHRLRTSRVEMLRILRDEPPTTPSRRVAQAGEANAAARQSSVTSLQRALHGELDWIVLKAMEKEPQRRYESANGLAQDLARRLAHEPVLAGPPGPGYRLKKLLRKYRGAVIATAVVSATAIAGAVIAIGFATRLAGKVTEFDQLAGVVLYERAVAAEQALYPPWPAEIEAMERWLREDCGRLLAMRPAIERTVAHLRARARLQTDAERQRERETHPRFASWRRAEQALSSLRRTQAIRAGAELVVPDLSAEQRTLEAKTLNDLAWVRVAPKPEERKVYGEEAFALACARAAVAKASDAERHLFLDTLAWALLVNGQDDEACARSAQALAAAPAEQKTAYASSQRDLGEAIANAAKIQADAEAEYRTLAAELATRHVWRFAADDASARFLHDTLVELLAKLARLESTEMVAVEQRRAWALRIGELTRNHPNARVTWDAARAAIAASARYAGQHLVLPDEDVIGLVPIGENPVTGLWEFYELRSAWDGKWGGASDPAKLPIPRHLPDGRIEVTGDTGIVFVLLPGGTFTMGAQHTRPDLPHYDPVADDDESPVHEVTLAPFFLARHELTRGQWRRLSGGEEPSWHRLGLAYAGNPEPIGYAHPVEQVDRTQSARLLTRHGLVLPTEAQWEYGCRAGTGTPWWPGPSASDLADCANLLDQAGVRGQPAWGRQEGDFDDDRVGPGPVGSYRANAFGLYDMHGNVWEWCLDEYGSYAGAVRAGDGLRLRGDGSATLVYRSGGFNAPASRARSSSRYMHAAAFNVSNLGLRPARALAP